MNNTNDGVNYFGISKSPLDGLNETELQLALNNPNLPDSLRLEIESRLANFESEKGTIDYGVGNVSAKTMSKSLPQFKNSNNDKSRYDRAGYIDIIVLMLTVWATCLCGMAYVYSQLNILG